MSEERAEYGTFGEGLTAGIKSVRQITNLEHHAIYTTMLALLKRMEWKNGVRCPNCENISYQGHKDDCELGKLVKVLETVVGRA